MIRALAAAPLLLLSGCAGLLAAGSAAGAIGGGLAIANQVAGTIDTTIQTACGEYQKGRAAANAVIATGLVPADATTKIGVIEEYGDAACSDPPAGDALSTAIWLGELVGQVATLTSVKPVSPMLPEAAPAPFLLDRAPYARHRAPKGRSGGRMRFQVVMALAPSRRWLPAAADVRAEGKVGAVAR